MYVYVFVLPCRQRVFTKTHMKDGPRLAEYNMANRSMCV